MAIEGDVIAVGAPVRNGYEGAVYIFRNDGSGWSETEDDILLAPHGPDAAGFYGSSVSVHVGATEDIVIGGAPEEGPGLSNVGAAYVHRYNGTSWDGGMKGAAELIEEKEDFVLRGVIGGVF